MEKISQTLAGRTAVLHLLPFSFSELKSISAPFDQYETLIFKGQYPRIYDRDIAPTDFYPAYIQTYIERDVRMMKISGTSTLFFNSPNYAPDAPGNCSLHQPGKRRRDQSYTAKAWLSILESSYILYRLPSYHRNFNKRLTKSPKLYFYDTGVACSLLGIREEGQVNLHYLKGALFREPDLNEFIKRSFHRGENNLPYFWQDSHGKEIDCLLVDGASIVPIEIKSGKR